MFDAGFTELLLIMVIALLVVGPERLPGLARKVGLWIGKARSYFNSVRSDIEREIRADELKSMLNQQQEEIQRLKSMVEDTGNELEADLKKDLDEAEQRTGTDDAAAGSADVHKPHPELDSSPDEQAVPEPEAPAPAAVETDRKSTKTESPEPAPATPEPPASPPTAATDEQRR
jgi:sec-independent protein translocase protein TatB